MEMKKLKLTIEERRRKNLYMISTFSILVISTGLLVLSFFLDRGLAYYISLTFLVVFGALVILTDHKLSKLRKRAIEREREEAAEQ